MHSVLAPAPHPEPASRLRSVTPVVSFVRNVSRAPTLSKHLEERAKPAQDVVPLKPDENKAGIEEENRVRPENAIFIPPNG